MITRNNKKTSQNFNARYYNSIISFRRNKFKLDGIKLSNTERNFLRWLAGFILRRIENEKIGAVYDNSVWVYEKCSDIAKELDICRETVTSITNKLSSKGIIKKAKLSSKYTDHTMWYTFNIDFLEDYYNNHPVDAYIENDSTKTEGEKIFTLEKNSNEQLEPPYGFNKSIKSKSENSKKENQEEAVKPKNTTAQDMIKLWNEIIGRKDNLNLTTAKYLVAAFKIKFNNSLDRFARYIRKIKSSAYLMGEKFILRLGWVLKFQTIDDIAIGAYATYAGDAIDAFWNGTIQNASSLLTEREIMELSEMIEKERAEIKPARMEEEEVSAKSEKERGEDIDLGELYNEWKSRKRFIRRR